MKNKLKAPRLIPDTFPDYYPEIPDSIPTDFRLSISYNVVLYHKSWHPILKDFDI